MHIFSYIDLYALYTYMSSCVYIPYYYTSNCHPRLHSHVAVRILDLHPQLHVCTLTFVVIPPFTAKRDFTRLCTDMCVACIYIYICIHTYAHIAFIFTTTSKFTFGFVLMLLYISML